MVTHPEPFLVATILSAAGLDGPDRPAKLHQVTDDWWRGASLSSSPLAAARFDDDSAIVRVLLTAGCPISSHADPTIVTYPWASAEPTTSSVLGAFGVQNHRVGRPHRATLSLLRVVTRSRRAERLSRRRICGAGAGRNRRSGLRFQEVIVAAGVDDLRPPEPAAQQCRDRRHQQRAHDQRVHQQPDGCPFIACAADRGTARP